MPQVWACIHDGQRVLYWRDYRPFKGECGAALSSQIQTHIVHQAINAVAIRHQRPYRAATAADDNLIVFHQGEHCRILPLNCMANNGDEGAPYKYDKVRVTSVAVSRR